MTAKRKILVLNGPNLDLLGKREPEIYGTLSLADIENKIEAHARARSAAVECRQSNHSGQLIEWLHEVEGVLGVVLNAGGLTHFDVALRDAVAALERPLVEVHISNIHARERFRRRSLIAAVAVAQISGLGWRGYLSAVDFLIDEFGAKSDLGFRAGAAPS